MSQQWCDVVPVTSILLRMPLLAYAWPQIVRHHCNCCSLYLLMVVTLVWQVPQYWLASGGLYFFLPHFFQFQQSTHIDLIQPLMINVWCASIIASASSWIQGVASCKSSPRDWVVVLKISLSRLAERIKGAMRNLPHEHFFASSWHRSTNFSNEASRSTTI